MENRKKIFCIGFHKTATTTLERALEHLGYSVCGVSHELVEALRNKNLKPVFDKVRKYDAFQDNPWPLLYKELDENFPGSKFILTLRDSEKWINSVTNHFANKETEMRKWIYGAGHPKGNRKLYIDKFESHNREVREYFKERENDLLVFDITAGEGWKKLCGFLGKEIPDMPFPHERKGKYGIIGKLSKKKHEILNKVYEINAERKK